MRRFSIFLLLIVLSSLARAGDIAQMLQLIDYLGVDYAGAVADGRVVNATEYEEMEDFAAAIVRQARDLPPGDAGERLRDQAVRLAAQIAAKASPAAVRSQTAAMRLSLIEGYQVAVVPRHAPDPRRGAALYSERCAGCHGASGDGKGPRAVGMEPPPIDFRDHGRYAQRNLYGLYNTITQGVAGTAMKSFAALPEADRWALAFYVGALAAGEVGAAEARELLADPQLAPLRQLQTLTVTTPAEARQAWGAPGARLMAYLRAHPAVMFESHSPLEYSRQRLDEALAAYREGDGKRAHRLAVEAYLGGFELVERGLDAMDAELRLEIEHAMTALRAGIRKGVTLAVLEAQVRRLKDMLDLAGQRLQQRGLSAGAAFFSAFFILLREGLEALLVVAALAAFLARTEHRGNIRYLHFGWVGALLLGFLTWWAAESLFDISGASREITEGIAALVAAALLFCVGFWLHGKSSAAQWRRLIEGSMQRALGGGVLWGLAGLSFIAVYREVFESILFFQALWMQSDAEGRRMALAGVAAGAALLAVLAWLIMRYSARLPLRQFFGFSGVLMFILALIFTGKGIAALQEAGAIPVSPVHFPRIDLLGIYPNLQGLLVQLALVLLALFLWYGLPRRRRAIRGGGTVKIIPESD